MTPGILVQPKRAHLFCKNNRPGRAQSRQERPPSHTHAHLVARHPYRPFRCPCPFSVRHCGGVGATHPCVHLWRREMRGVISRCSILPRVADFGTANTRVASRHVVLAEQPRQRCTHVASLHSSPCRFCRNRSPERNGRRCAALRPLRPLRAVGAAADFALMVSPDRPAALSRFSRHSLSFIQACLACCVAPTSSRVSCGLVVSSATLCSSASRNGAGNVAGIPMITTYLLLSTAE